MSPSINWNQPLYNQCRYGISQVIDAASWLFHCNHQYPTSACQILDRCLACWPIAEIANSKECPFNLEQHIPAQMAWTSKFVGELDVVIVQMCLTLKSLHWSTMKSQFREQSNVYLDSSIKVSDGEFEARQGPTLRPLPRGIDLAVGGMIIKGILWVHGLGNWLIFERDVLQTLSDHRQWWYHWKDQFFYCL